MKYENIIFDMVDVLKSTWNAVEIASKLHKAGEFHFRFGEALNDFSWINNLAQILRVFTSSYSFIYW